MNTPHPNAAETKSLLAALVAAGFELLHCNNGGDEDEPPTLENLCCCDEAGLVVKAPDGRKLSIFLVMGNSPGELVADYTVHSLLDTVISAESQKWSKGT